MPKSAMGQETVSEGDIQGILDNEEPGLTDLFGVYEAAEASYFAAANASVPTSVTTASTTPQPSR